MEVDLAGSARLRAQLTYGVAVLLVLGLALLGHAAMPVEERSAAGADAAALGLGANRASGARRSGAPGHRPRKPSAPQWRRSLPTPLRP